MTSTPTPEPCPMPLDPRQQKHLWRCSWMKPEDCGCRTKPDGSPWYVCRHPLCDRPAKACGGYCPPCFRRTMDEAGLSPTVRLGRELVRASAFWFPEAHARGEWDIVKHFTLGIGGESGEVIDVVKKADVCGGFSESCDRHSDGKHSLDTLAGEVGDLLTYVYELCAVVGIDPDAAVRACQQKCADRWGELPPRDPAPNSKARR